jgi:hypothetical protein
MPFRFAHTRAAQAAAFAALLPLGAIAAAAPARAGEPKAQITEFGLYEIERSGRRPAPRTVGGWVGTVGKAKLIRKTDLILGQLGRTFGIRVRFKGLPMGAPITVRTLHPPKTNPKSGRTLRQSEYDSRVGLDARGLFLFTFDDRWELAEGKWAFQILYQGKVIGEKRFKVVIALN